AEKSEFSQRTIFQIAPYLTLIEWRKIWKQLLDNEEITFSAEYITRQGTVYPVDMRAKLLRLSDRKVCFCLIENLIISRAYQKLLEITSTITRVGSWQWNPLQNHLLLGKEVYSLLELPQDFQPSVRNLLRLLKQITEPAEFELFKAKLRHSLKTGEQFDFELTTELPISNQRCRFRLVGVPTFKEGQTVNLYGAFQDISNIALRTDQMYLMEYSVENAYEMIYWIDPAGSISYCNEKTCTILGYTREELAQINYMSLVADFNPDTWIDWDSFKKQTILQAEIALKAKNGEVIPVYTIANYIHYRDREIACIFTRDLREEKRRERLAQVTQYLLDQANDIIYWFDSEGFIQYANEAFYKKLGYEASEIVGKRGRDFFPEIPLEEVNNAWRTLRSGRNIFGEYVITGKDNRKISVEASIALTQFEGKEYCSAIMRDLTERDQKEKELQERERLLNITSFALNKTSEMIYWVRMDGTFISVNQALCDKSGYTQEALMQKNLNELFINVPKEVLAARWEKVRNGETLIGEAPMTTKSGAELPVRFHVSPTELDHEPCICGILTDVSELKQLENALQEHGKLIEMNRDSLLDDPDIAYWKRSDGSLIHANPAFFAKLGYTPADLPELHVDQIYEDFDWRASLERWQTTLRVGVRTGLLVLLTKDGKRLEGEYQLSAVNFEGEICAFYIIRESGKHSNIEDRQQVQQRISELVAYMPLRPTDMIYWTDDEGFIVYANDKYCRTIGYKKEEVIGSHVLKFYPNVTPEQAEMGFATIRQAQSITGEAVITTRHNEKIVVEQSASVVNLNQRAYFSIVLHEITEEKRKEQERQRLLEITSFSLDRTNEMIYWLDSKGDFLSFNETMLQKLGYTAEELKNIRLEDLFKNDSKEVYAQSWATLQNGQSIQGEGLIFRKDNTAFPIEYSVVPVELNGEQCVCGRLTDIAERKAKENELRKAFTEINSLKEKLESENLLLKENIKLEKTFNEIISTSDRYKKVLKQVEQVADTEATVLILGETGTGKELLARALHQLSRRSDRPMVKINCGALPENLIESELFGHEKGAFTGAYQQKKGRFELADKGTIFLDEIGELPLDLQVKLLRVLQEGEFERIGGTKSLKVDVRVIAATNRNLAKLIEEGKFRQDLFYRLNVFPIYNIPLRERSDDIPLLVRYFTDKFSQKIGKHISNIPQKELEKLQRYHFPGNVRELENIIERAVILSNNEVLNVEAAFTPYTSGTDAIQQEEPIVPQGGFKSLEKLQRDYIIQVLRHTGGQISGAEGAANLLEMNDKTLYSKIKKLDIRREEYLS
ncbi:MAG: PAS domain S-box protein, partial [Saprospiraceae bacterium]